MNRNQTLLICLILLAVAVTPAYAVVGDGWDVTIPNALHDLTDHDITVDVKNLLDYNRDFGLGLYLQELNFDQSLVNDVYMYEWKPIAQEFPLYEFRLVEESCFDGNTSQNYNCSYIESYQSGTEQRDILTWKPTKMALITQYDKVSTEYANVLVPRLNSECDYDYNGEPYDCNGTKRFRITWKTPIVETEIGFGSSGYFGLYDALGGFDYDPDWLSGWTYCKNLTVTTFGIDNIVKKNITAIRLTNSYEARIVNTSCNNGGTTQNFTVKSSYVAGAADDWIDVEFLSPNTNTTYSVYYGNAGAADPAYLFLLFNPDLSSCDFTNDWYSEDQGKYSCHGFLNATIIDGAEYGSDQIQTENSYVAYGKITVYDEVYMTAASGNEFYTRWLTGTTTQGAWDNYINILMTPQNEWRVYKTSPTVDTDTNVVILYQTNTSFKAHYDPAANTNAYWAYNNTGTLMWNVNSTSVVDVGFWGTFVDSTSSNADVWYYEFKIYMGFVNPVIVGEPTVAIGAEQESPVSPPLWSGNSTTFPANYDGSIITANITWANGSASNVVNTTTVNITSNFSGSNATVNMPLISGTGLSGAYGFQELLGAGGYFWYSNASTNDTATNVTNEFTFTIAKHSSSCAVVNTVGGNDSHITYPNPITVSGTCDNPEGNWTLWNNNTNISHLNNTATIYAVDYAGFKTNVTETDNYTSASSFVFIYIDQGNLTNASFTNITFNTSTTVTQDTVVLVTCNIPIGIAANDFKLYNDTAQIGNTSAVHLSPSVQQDNFTCNSTGNSNWTAGTALKSLTVTAGAGLSVNVFDEETQNALTFNITINNGTQSATVFDQTNPYTNATILGSITIEVWAVGYPSRFFYTTVSGVDIITVNASLLSALVGSDILFYTFTISEQPISNCLVNAERLLSPSSYTTIGQKNTDAAGSASIFLDTSTQYKVNATCSGFETQSFLIFPSASPYIMYFGAFNLSYNTTYKNLYFYTLPAGTALASNNSYEFTYYINSVDSALQYYGWNITAANGSIIHANNTTGTAGTNYTFDVNTTLWDGVLTMNYWFKKSGFALVNNTNAYTVYQVSGNTTSLWATIEDLKTGANGWDITANQFAIMSLILTVVLMAGMSQKTSMFGSGMFGLLIFIAFTFAGIYIYESAYVVGWEVIALFGVAIAAIIYIRGGFS